MTIHTQESVSGFVASSPQLTQTEKGDARLYFRFGQEHFRKEDDGSFTQLETTFHHLVMFGRSANHAHDRFRKGDNFIAEGDSKTYTKTVKGQPQEGDQFVASRIGHDNNITRYTVDRTGPERDAAKREAPVQEQVQQALAGREAQLDPEPATAARDNTPPREAVAR